MHRRNFLKNSTTLLGMMSLQQWLPFDAIKASSFDNDVVKLNIGKIKCTIFKDILFKYAAKDFFINAGSDELSTALAQYKLAPDNIPSPFIAMLLQYDDRKILVDTGIGFSENPVNVRGNMVTFKGRLHHLLLQEGIQGEDITDVIITHFHPDHIGGVFSENGKLQFPKARFHMHADEWDFWHSSRSDAQPDQFKFFIERNITKLKDHNLNLVKGDFTEVLPGITAVKAEGHTAGQIALIAHSDKQHLLYVSDAFLHPLHIERLDWQTNYDLDHGKAKASRIKLLDLAKSENMLINAFHFDFPCLGRAEKKANGWRWQYTNK